MSRERDQEIDGALSDKAIEKVAQYLDASYSKDRAYAVAKSILSALKELGWREPEA